jgi:F-type H+-transporting ATPase subunit b
MLLSIAHAATHAVDASPGGLSSLGLDGRALVFQIINFGLLLLILRAFAYKPVIRALEARRRKIEESLRTAEEVARAKSDLEVKMKQQLNEANRQAQTIIDGGQARADTLLKEAQERARTAAGQIEEQAASRLAHQVASVRAELKQEAVQLVAAAAEQVLRERLDTERDQALIAEAVAAAEQHLSRTKS